MPAWMLAALRLLALAATAGGAAELGARAIPGSTELDVLGGGGTFPSLGIPGLEDIFGGKKDGRRRRRRRALTASDRADIAFIAGMISKAAAKDFAVQLAARPR